MGKKKLIKLLRWLADWHLARGQWANDCVDALNTGLPLFVVRDRREKAERAERDAAAKANAS